MKRSIIIAEPKQAALIQKIIQKGPLLIDIPPELASQIMDYLLPVQSEFHQDS